MKEVVSTVLSVAGLDVDKYGHNVCWNSGTYVATILFNLLPFIRNFFK
jgi:hypothetical protein